MLSIWLGPLIDATYGEPLSLFRQGQGWQEDVKERFIRSRLRVRHASAYTAEQDPDRPYFHPLYDLLSYPLLYRNADHTNINVWGYVATAGGYLYIIAARYRLRLLSPLV